MPIAGVALVRVCACSLLSRLVSLVTNQNKGRNGTNHGLFRNLKTVRQFETFMTVAVSQSISQKVSEGFRNFQKVSESFKKFQKLSESFRKFQKVSESFRKFQKVSESLRKFEKV